MFGYSKQAYYKHQQCRLKWQTDRQAALSLTNQLRYKLPRLGGRKVHYMLKEDFKKRQLKIGRDKLFSILREEGMLIAPRRSYTKTTNSKHWMRKYPNTVKETFIHRPEQVWVADITYLRTMNGFNYLHLITDAYSKQVMGYKVSKSMNADDTAQALRMAIKSRKYPLMPLVHHSDRGLQYCSETYTKLLRENSISISMTEQSDPYENAVAERINGILKDEFSLNEFFEDREQLKHQVKESIELYNNLRPHLSNHMLTPNDMHKQDKLKPKAWRKKTTTTFEGSCGFLPSHLIN